MKYYNSDIHTSVQGTSIHNIKQNFLRPWSIRKSSIFKNISCDHELITMSTWDQYFIKKEKHIKQCP